MSEKLEIRPLNSWKFLVDWVERTEEELLDALIALPDGLLTKVWDKQLANKREWYEKLKPGGFLHAPEKAKKYRETLKDVDDREQKEHLQKILAYNEDGTVTLPTMNETFCADLAWWKNINREKSKELAKSKWYHLLSDRNDCDDENTKKSTDRYKLEELFWPYAKQWALFHMLGFDNDRYWTATPYKNDQWEVISGVARYRGLVTNDYRRIWGSTDINNRVCGFKDSM